MNPFKLYRESQQRELSDEELKSLNELIEEFPWFALPRIILAKAEQSEDNISIASAYAVNRSYLQAYLNGKTFLKPQARPKNHDFMEESTTSERTTPAYPTFSLRNQLFSAVAFDQYRLTFAIDELPFSAAVLGNSTAFHPFMDVGIREMTLKHQRLIKKIKKEVKHAKPVAKQQENTIISDFLDKNPRIQRMDIRNSSSMETPTSVQRSIQQDEDMVTETLAKIHLKQNNKGEAIRIYEKLGLLFPEKSAYFDAQIEKIKEP